MGAGVAGLSAALLLARDGHQVTLIDKDGFGSGDGAPQDAPNWNRPGVPHFLQPHAFIPRGRSVLREHFPDVYQSLLGNGAHEVDMRPKIPGPIEPQDEELQYLAVRRPMIEWALREAIRSEPGVQVRSASYVTGFNVTSGRGVVAEIDGIAAPADFIVDALGRRSPVDRWLADVAIASNPLQTSDCGVVYYSRYYVVKPGHSLPDGPWLLGPRGDLGYLGFATFPGDNGTFAVLLAVPTGVGHWRALRDPEIFEAAAARIPALGAWLDPENVVAITAVMAMAGLRNSIRDPAPLINAGVVPVGDAYGHTDPFLALGLTFAMLHATELVASLRNHAQLNDSLAAYVSATQSALSERFGFATELDSQRLAHWKGSGIDFSHREGAYEMFSVFAAGAASMLDAEIFRVSARRNGLLDSINVLDRDVALQLRIGELFAQMRTTPRPPAGPTYEQMLETVAS